MSRETGLAASISHPASVEEQLCGKQVEGFVATGITHQQLVLVAIWSEFSNPSRSLSRLCQAVNDLRDPEADLWSLGTRALVQQGVRI